MSDISEVSAILIFLLIQLVSDKNNYYNLYKYFYNQAVILTPRAPLDA